MDAKNNMATLIRCVFGPRLYKTYRTVQSESRVYEGNAAEKYGDHIIRSLSLMWSISIYTSPVIIGVLYKRGYFSIDGVFSFLKFVALVGIAFMGSLMLRGSIGLTQDHLLVIVNKIISKIHNEPQNNSRENARHVVTSQRHEENIMAATCSQTGKNNITS